ncbi:NAD(P)-dependent alcohol dehydrogenase [Telluribacter sp. SYSU D00476]|uniref:NAD(P)-dependent alcohol dehydrogenase n=1 Tax=Telluribacter sp. SYSU D00476 TaxID=2811430 RepID=UPI001FF31EF6|nr:NAD(P)-dependent alcohol dehydrogenase [Telluribacter sp. SYSU D00476]
MKAAIYTQYGPPEVVSLQEVDTPTPKIREVLIRVHATTVNRTDSAIRNADNLLTRLFSGPLKPRFKTLGNEFAGEVEAVGPEVTSLRIGDKVFGYNDTRFGAHAEYMTMRENGAITTLPAGLSYQEAAPITEGAHYALSNIRAARIKKGQRVLVNGATGGIGSAAVQLIKYLGAEVTAVCSTPYMELVRSLGADEVIDYTTTDFTALDQTFDVVFDAVGKSSFDQCKQLLTENGIYLSTELGRNSENILLALTTPLLGGKKVLFPIPSINQDDVKFFKELIEQKKYKPVIDRTYPLEQIVEAYRYVETGQKIGNVVITLSAQE